MNSKKKIIIIAAIAAAVVLVAAGIIIGVVLNNKYLDNMKDYDPVSDTYIYNGYEIVNEDGLLYLTKDGKKVSKTGYASIESVNDGYKNVYNSLEKGKDMYADYTTFLANAEGVKIYDYFLARKPDANTYFLLDGEGKELVIAGENLEWNRYALPYVEFKDNVTGKLGALSLEALDSDLSSATEEEITVKLFDSTDVEAVNETVANKFIYIGIDKTAGAAAPTQYIFNASGKVMVTGAGKACRIAKMGDANDRTAENWLIYDYVSYTLYNGTGAQLNTDVISIDGLGDSVIAIKNPNRENKEATENRQEMVVYTESGSTFSILDTEFDIGSIDGYEDDSNVFYVKSRATDAEKYRLYNVLNGSYVDFTEISDVSSNTINRVNAAVVVKNTDGKYVYVDKETGEVLLTSDKYGDMKWYNTGVLTSATEYTEKIATLTGDKLPVAYLHFVAPTKTPVDLTLNFGEAITGVIFNDDKGNAAYTITNTNNDSSDYSIVKTAVYAPFAGAKTAFYDNVQTLNVFAEGAPVVLATDYDANKYEFIDAATGAIIKTVAPGSGEAMALTSIKYNNTYALYADYDQGVEYAVFYTVEEDENGNVKNKGYFALYRPQAMTGTLAVAYEDMIVAPVKVAELGNNVDSIVASSERGNYYYASKYMTVQISKWATDIYEIAEDYSLNKVSSVPYSAAVYRYGNELDEVYVYVNNQDNQYALYTVEGEMIVGFHDYAYMTEDGNYIIATREGVYGAYKYDAEKNRVKQILDFRFVNLSYVGDGGFVAVEAGYEAYLYDGKKLVKSEPISMNLYEDGSTVKYNVYVDEETGKLMVSEYSYYNIDGKLYVHRGEGEEIVNTYAVGTVHQYGVYVNDTAPVAVVFRNTDGSVIQTKVIYNTAKSKFDFKMIDEGAWYQTAVKDLQKIGSAVTADGIKAGAFNDGFEGKSVINLYKAHEVTPAN